MNKNDGDVGIIECLQTNEKYQYDTFLAGILCMFIWLPWLSPMNKYYLTNKHAKCKVLEILVISFIYIESFLWTQPKRTPVIHCQPRLRHKPKNLCNSGRWIFVVCIAVPYGSILLRSGLWHYCLFALFVALVALLQILEM